MKLEDISKRERKQDKPIELIAYQSCSGWIEDNHIISTMERIVYLGECISDGDLFAVYDDSEIYIYKGHLNSGNLPK